ncbi:MAG: DUF4380 domain-containing protein [Armatimonadetes bacterium]|nr:DUF4380 domain-containing protein [Armatimonadota bacterium]
MRLKSSFPPTCLTALASVGLLLVVAGCGGGVEQAQPRSSVPSITGGYGYGGSVSAQQVKPSAQVQVTEADFLGHRALKMTNGLVTVVAVPDLGGRIMRYDLGPKPFLWVNTAEVQSAPSAGPKATPPAAAPGGKRVWHNYGGYKVWPAPQSRWHGPPDPSGSQLDGGHWVGRIVKPRGDVGEIELVSPADKTVTGLQITRRVTLRVGSTELTVTETFKNVGARPVEWSIWDVTQVPGELSPGEGPTEDARVYIPLNPSSSFDGGFKELLAGGSGQWRRLDDGLLQVSYAGKLGKIGADSTAGWIAYSDARDDWAFVKRFDVTPGATYPDGGCTVEVFTSGELHYLEVEVLGPLTRLAPGKQTSFTEHWYAARVGAPIRQVTDGAVIAQPLTLQKKKGKLHLVGSVGVFQPGKLDILLLDQGGKPVGTPISIAASPVEKLALDRELSAPAEAAAVKVKLTAGQSSWQLARLPLEAYTAAE